MRGKVPTNSTLLFMWSLVAIVPGIAAQEISPDRQQDQPKEKTARPVRLRMSKAVICSSIDGYERFKVLPGAAQTAEEKLLVYYRPLYYKTVQKDDYYLAHFTQEGRIRRRGEKTVLLSKKNLLDYEAKSHEPLGPIYLRNSVSLKGLPPANTNMTSSSATRTSRARRRSSRSSSASSLPFSPWRARTPIDFQSWASVREIACSDGRQTMPGSAPMAEQRPTPSTQKNSHKLE